MAISINVPNFSKYPIWRQDALDFVVTSSVSSQMAAQWSSLLIVLEGADRFLLFIWKCV